MPRGKLILGQVMEQMGHHQFKEVPLVNRGAPLLAKKIWTLGRQHRHQVNKLRVLDQEHRPLDRRLRGPHPDQLLAKQLQMGMHHLHPPFKVVGLKVVGAQYQ
jgi:hypothetical protein